MARSGGLGIGGFLALMFVACAALLFLGSAPAAPGGPTAAETSKFWAWVDAQVAQAEVAANNRALLESSTHAVERHGVEAIAVAESFAPSGYCNSGNPSAVLREHGLGRWILCAFLPDGGVDMHVMEKNGDTVTDIPSKDIRNPQNYLRNQVVKRGYTLEDAFGDIPRWFNELFAPLR